MNQEGWIDKFQTDKVRKAFEANGTEKAKAWMIENGNIKVATRSLLWLYFWVKMGDWYRNQVKNCIESHLWVQS